MVITMSKMAAKLLALQQELIREDLDEDTNLGGYEAEEYSAHMDLLFYLYKPECVGVTPKRLYWQVDTGSREIIRRKMKKNLSKPLFEKIDAHLNYNNKP